MTQAQECAHRFATTNAALPGMVEFEPGSHAVQEALGAK